MHETLARKHVHLPGFPIGSSVLCRRPNICLALAHEHLIDLLWEGTTIVDNSASPSIYNTQFLDPELVPCLCEDVIAHVIRLIWPFRKWDEYGDALRLVGIEDDCDTAIGHLQWCLVVCRKSAADGVGSNSGLWSAFEGGFVDSGHRRGTEEVK